MQPKGGYDHWDLQILRSVPKFPASLDKGILKDKRVLFFDEEECRGNRIEKLDNAACIAPVIESIFIESEEWQFPQDGCIWAYDEGCLTGNKIEICKDQKIENFNVASIKFPKAKLNYVILSKSESTNTTIEYGTSYGIKESHFKKVNLWSCCFHSS